MATVLAPLSGLLLVEEMVPFEVIVDVAGSEITVDFSGAPPQQAGPTNAPACGES